MATGAIVELHSLATFNTELSQLTTHLLVGLAIICCDRQLANGHQGRHELPREGVVQRIWCHACRTQLNHCCHRAVERRLGAGVDDIMLPGFEWKFACLTHAQRDTVLLGHRCAAQQA